MTSFNFYLFLLALLSTGLVFWLHRSAKFNTPTAIIEDLGEVVVIRQTLFSRATTLGGKSIKKNDIVKLQRAGRCLTLFSQGGNAYDMWISRNFITNVIAHCQELFPNATYHEIQS
ncbi:hypothetical protein ACO1PK_00260 [Alishewanella sp. d11]|uniref:hypothetical protein n=1 Tax=Alishewanella sp. d11 TaxID=3414030 RepID=UPI003BF77E8F